MEKNTATKIKLFCGQGSCFSWFKKETLWSLSYLRDVPSRSPSTSEVYCHYIEGIPRIHQGISVRLLKIEKTV